MKKLAQAEDLPIDKLKSFEGHPFYVKDDDDMVELTESIRQQGVLTPLVVRPINNDEYEVISGHWRLHACQKAGIEMIPAFIYSMDRSEAVVAMVDSNLHREKLLPSEKAFAYKMKMDALKHQGKTCGQVGHKSRDALSEIESGRQIQRYIRLTNLIPGILQKVDSGEITLTPAVELSYLNKELQEIVLDAMLQEDCTPSYSQTVRMKNLYNRFQLDIETIYEIKPLEPQQIATLLEEASADDYANLFTVAIFTGMRQGELLGLTWENVNFDAGTITVKQQLQCKDGIYFLQTPKNGKGRVIVPAQVAMDALRDEK